MVDAVLALPEGTKLMILAPVAREKKGEFTELFADMQAQGYVRFRVDGEVTKAADLAQAQEDREARHRRGDRPHQGARSRSPTCASGWPRASRRRCAWPRAAPSRWRHGHRRRRALFNAKFACPVCSYSLAELEPRLFSASTRPWAPARACDGLGHREVFDPRAWSPSPRSAWPAAPSRAGTAATATTSPCSKAWPSTTSSTLRRPSSRCPKRCSTCCCTARAKRRSSSATRWKGPTAGKKRSASTPSKASSEHVERRYRETDSALVREELARYRNTQPCPDCGGTRLRARRATCS
jgi:excinuclease ABC subunit A